MSNPSLLLSQLLEELELPADSPSSRLLREAYCLAHERHGEQLRGDGARVADHVVAVAGLALAAGERDSAVLAAALLHDLLEKTATDARELRDRFGDRVADLVEVLTNRPGEQADSAALRAEQAGPAALLLRLCDRLDGVRGAHQRPAPARDSFLATTRVSHLPLAQRHYPALAEQLRRALQAAERRSQAFAP